MSNTDRQDLFGQPRRREFPRPIPQQRSRRETNVVSAQMTLIRSVFRVLSELLTENESATVEGNQSPTRIRRISERGRIRTCRLTQILIGARDGIPKYL